jgi:hypothetical protein
VRLYAGHMRGVAAVAFLFAVLGVAGLVAAVAGTTLGRVPESLTLLGEALVAFLGWALLTVLLRIEEHLAMSSRRPSPAQGGGGRGVVCRDCGTLNSDIAERCSHCQRFLR